MTPTNIAMTPEIKNIADNNGDKHTVVPTQHSHSISEVTNLQSFITTYSHKIDKNNGNTYAYVEAMADTDNGKAKVEIGIEDTEEEEFSRKVSITWGNIKNLIRALLNPSTTPENTNDKLITSKAVFTALSNKANTTHTHYNITNSYYGSIGVYEDIETHNGCVSIRLWNEEDQQEENFAITISALVNILQPDSTPTANSTKLVTSGGVKAALDTYSQAIMWPQIPLDISTLDYNRVYTVVVNNMTGDPMSVEDAFDMTNLPSSENRIIFNQPMGSVEIERQEEFGLRIIRTQSGIYAFYDGKLGY